MCVYTVLQYVLHIQSYMKSNSFYFFFLLKFKTSSSRKEKNEKRKIFPPKFPSLKFENLKKEDKQTRAYFEKRRTWKRI